MSLPSSTLFKRLRGLAKAILLSAPILIFAAPFSSAYAQCSTPAGVAGQVIFSEDANIPTYCDGTDWVGMAGGDPVTGGGDYVPNAVTFDGTNDWMTSAVSGAIDTKQWSFSVWFRRNNLGASQRIYSGTNFRFNIRISSAGTLQVNAGSSSSATVTADLGTVNDTEWHHLLFSVDMTDVNKRHIFLDGLDQGAGVFTTYNDDVIDFTVSQHSIGGYQDGTDKWDGDLSDIWIDWDRYIDFSVTANREKFINASGNPVYLGADGSIPTGNAPDIFLSGPTATWHTNKGAGGGFTENGTLTDAASIPYTPRTKIVPSGLVGHWRLDEISGTTAIDSSGNGHDGTYANGLTPAGQTLQGAIDNGITFHTDNDEAIQMTTSVSDFWASTDLTISAWVNLKELSGYSTVAEIPGFFSFSSSFNDRALLFSAPGWNTTTGVWFSNVTTGLTPTDEWAHVAVSYSYANTAIDPTFYINGQNAGISPAFSPAGTYTTPTATELTLGNATGSFSRAFNGYLDDIRIYNRLLTDSEVAELAAAKDGIRYNDSMRTMEYFDGNQMVAMTPDWPEPPASKSTYDCPDIGNVCSDGTIRAGTSPDGNFAMYTTRCDVGQTWDGSTCTGTSSSITWNEHFAHTDYTVSGATDPNDGDGNTALLLTVDADGTEVGVQQHDAAIACDTLVSDGHSDWYLPAENELQILYTNRATIGNFTGGQTWSSTETGQGAAYRIDFSSGAGNGATKNGSFKVRCVRKSEVQLTGSGDLVAHWKLDETTGTTAVDSSGNGNNGSLSGSLDLTIDSTSGPVGTAYSFIRNASDTVTISDPGAASVLDFNSGDSITISAWVKPPFTPTGFQGVVCKGEGSVQTNYCLKVNPNRVAFWYRNTSPAYEEFQSNTDVLNIGEWNHIVATNTFGTAGAAKIYVNGVDVGSAWSQGSGAGTPVVNDDNLNISGETTTSNFFDGEIDDVRIYRRALTNSEIQELYQMGTPVGSSTALPQGCPNVGDICDDGSVYTGLSPDGSVAMFTTTIELETTLPFNNGNATDFILTSTSGNSGETNTNTLVTTDSDSATAGFQTHQAAQYCYDLNAYGADDWYLPSTAEYDLILPAIYAIGDYTTLTTTPDYHSSNELDLDDSSKRRLITTTGALDSGSYPKESSTYIRCARKGPAPRCANPYGLEGQMIYNTNGNVVQYCDGARWIAIGKDN